MPQTYYIGGKKITSEKPLTEEEIDEIAQSQQTTPAPQEKGFLSKAWDTAMTAPEPVRRLMRSVGESIVPSEIETGIPGPKSVLSFLGGALGGVGEIGTPEEVTGAASFASPGNLALSAVGMGEAAAVNTALRGVKSAERAVAAARTAQRLGTARKVLSAPVAAHGAINLTHGESTPMERLMAIPELAGGLAGLKIPRFSGPARFTETPPTVTQEGLIGPRRLPPGDFEFAPESPIIDADIIGDQSIQPPVRPPINRGNVLQGEVLPPPMELDPRISSIRPEYPAPFEPPPSGEMGPPSIGFRTPDLTQFRNAPTDEGIMAQFGPTLEQEVSGNDLVNNEIKAIIERNRETSRAAIDQELGVTPEEQAMMRGRAEPELINRQIEPLESIEDIEGPSFARTREGRIKIGADIRRSAQELTTGYSTDLPGIMVRESVQNALDAIKATGEAGKLGVHIYNNGIEISDTGRGMSLKELETVFSDLHSSGKVGQAGATGGKGVGKAAYMLGGQHFIAETITTEKGKRVKYTIEGTPEQLLTEGVHPVREEMPSTTPTGTKIRTIFTPEQQAYQGRTMMKNIMKYSRGITPEISGNLYMDKYDPAKLAEITKRKEYTDPDVKWAGRENDRIIANEDLGEGNVSLIMDKKAELKPRTFLKLQILNNGMFQYSKNMWLNEETPGLPEEIIIDVAPKFEEGAPEYPFPVQRESMKESFDKKVDELIKEKLIKPLATGRKAKLQQIYDNLAEISHASKVRRNIFFDPGDRLTPQEKEMFLNSDTVNQLTTLFDLYLDDIVTFSGEESWVNKLEGVGIVLDPGMHGVHIPNPSAPRDNPKSIILINPFVNGYRMTPEDLALNLAVTVLHEAAHIGTKPPVRIPKLNPEDISDPLAAKFLETYMQEVQNQGGLDMGHGMEFVKRLGEIYAKTGIKRSLIFVEEVQKTIGSPGSNDYSPEFQELLSIYSESRGREPVTEDFLSGTGVKQTTTPGGRGSTTGNNQGDAGGTTPHQEGIFEKLIKDPLTAERVREFYNTARGLVSVDLPFLTSAALRQGKFHAFSNSWWGAWVNQAKAFSSEKAYKSQQIKIETNPLYTPKWSFVGNRRKYLGSIAEQHGLKLTDINKGLSNREEMLRNELAEKIPYYGKYVRASNRAYTSFLNTIRTETYQQILTDLGIWDGQRITDSDRARAWADFINTTTGIGDLSVKLGPVEVNAERYSKLISDAFWSPRLQMSNIKMLNPNTYFNEPRETRSAYLTALTRAIGAWMAAATILKFTLKGARVSDDPNSSDFGKVRVGNVRLDPGGGLQQYMVINHRIAPVIASDLSLGAVQPKDIKLPMRLPRTGFPPADLASGYLTRPGGGITSPVSGQFNPYGVGFKPETAGSDAFRFVSSKLHPIPRGLIDIGTKSQYRPVYVGDKALQMILPMYTSDLADVLRADPTLVPIVLFGSSIGMGTQVFEGGPSKPTITPLFGLDKYDVSLR